ncbi:unnamed protein product [Thlaspi arvense]|uniref:Retrotransposon gag domain-containing protein n=1 Tax=Thlaspi arvense TaxID=13288 RepID=A0AAU9T5V0_THLAR|nr:unnamed protein product [Thlaspi arvense]
MQSGWGPSENNETEVNSGNVELSMEGSEQRDLSYDQGESRHTRSRQEGYFEQEDAYPNQHVSGRDHGRSTQTRERSREFADRGEDSMRKMMHEMHDYLMQQQPMVANVPSQSSTPSDFLRTVKLMKDLGTTYFGGGTNPFDADNWLQNMKTNFAATRCFEQNKKDIAVFYLERDVMGWWSSIEHHYNHIQPTWQDFSKEFTRKYFPLEARDRLEAQFMRLE